jgi:hypothetical protein
MTGAPALLRWGIRLISAPPEKAAAAIAPLLLAPDYADRSGRFFKDGKEIKPPSYTTDPDVGRRLWDVDASLVGLDGVQGTGSGMGTPPPEEGP